MVNNEMNDGINEVPTLTFEPFEEEVKVVEVKEKKQEAVVFDDSFLTEEEKKMVEEFAAKIDITNSNMILQYGAGSQKKIADFSESALSNVRTKDLGEIGGMLTNVVLELKNFDTTEEKGGFLGFFKKSADKLTVMKEKYNKVETNIGKICTVLENHQVQLFKDIAVLDKMYELNKVYYKELSMYILAGKKKLEKLEKEELPALLQKASLSGLPEDAQAANDFQALCNRFEKKIHDLELTRIISIQMAPQIRLVQNNDTLMSDKIQSTIVNTIPLWKSQMALALGVAHSTDAARAQREVTDMTNELLRKNAETLKISTIETAKESERGIVDIETLKITNEALISTLDEVMRIQVEGRQKRKEAEMELHEIEEKLKDKLLSLRG